MVDLWNSGRLQDCTVFKFHHQTAFCHLSNNKVSQNPFFQFSSIPPFDLGEKRLSFRFMLKSDSALSREATIINELGLHARSAAKIAKLAQPATGSVWIAKEDRKADASSIVDILTLACEKGTRITICVENKGDLQILEDITKLVESGFGE
jgi:phosphotransferase system HPr (HPr) family protein